MYTFVEHLRELFATGVVDLYVVFFAFVWVHWTLRYLLSRRYRPFTDPEGLTAGLRTSVIVPVYNEPEPVFRQVLSSVRANDPTEIIVVVDGGDPKIAAIASEYADRVLCIPKQGKRAALVAGMNASDRTTDIVLALDSDTMWQPNMLRELLKPFADPRVGGATPHQLIFNREDNNVRRLADWIEDLRYHLTVPAQSLVGGVGCLAGRTIAYRREAFEPAAHAMLAQKIFGVPQHIGDDRVLTNEILNTGWRSVYQSTAKVWTDAPNDWRTFARQQVRWGRSSQRETFLSLGWLWRKPLTLWCFAADMAIPFMLWALMVTMTAHLLVVGVPADHLLLAYVGMLVSIGLRQVPHFRRYPKDLRRLPAFVLQLTFFLSPVRLVAFGTMLHQSWNTRGEEASSGSARLLRSLRDPIAQAQRFSTALTAVGLAVLLSAIGAGAARNATEGRPLAEPPPIQAIGEAALASSQLEQPATRARR